MLAISVELLQGTFRADPDGSATTGRLRKGEWPPAPSRLFAAFVAADGTRDRVRVTTGEELKWFERLPPPVIHAHGKPWHQRLHPRYVARGGQGFASLRKRVLTHLEYIGRQGVEVRPGVRVAPRDPRILYRWDASCPDDILNALRLRAARIGYIGAADSPVRVRIRTGTPDPRPPGERFRPKEEGDVYIRVPEVGDLRLLDRVYDAWVQRGVTVARVQFPALRHEARYVSPEALERVDRGGVVAWLRLHSAVPGRRVTALTAVFKKAVLSGYQQRFGEPPAVLHGHGFDGRGYDLARFLALPDAGYPRSRGRIHGLALWLPPGCEPQSQGRIRRAAGAISRLWGSGLDVRVSPHAGEDRPFAATPPRWTRSSRCWVTAFPAVHERRVPLDLTEISKWCEHAGLPEPSAFRSARSPLIPGGVDLAPVEVNRPGKPGLPYSHVQIWFTESVEGPVAIGSARQRGLGLCVNLSHGEDSDV